MGNTLLDETDSQTLKDHQLGICSSWYFPLRASLTGATCSGAITIPGNIFLAKFVCLSSEQFRPLVGTSPAHYTSVHSRWCPPGHGPF
jgi:hypothetical protein